MYLTEGMFLDDIGSFPLPNGVKLDGVSQEQYLDLVRDAFSKKISAGVEVPTYPQFRDMIRMFLDLIQDPALSESPYLIKKEYAQIVELQALSGNRGRVCVTGPVELYLSIFGATNYLDVLYNLSESIARFLEKAKESGIMTVASLDEPSLGISSSIVFDQEELLQALEIASRPCKGMDCELHLHSPLFAELFCQVSGINIIGIESAAHPDYLRLIDKRILDDTDTFLRAGIARTDILAMTAQLNDRLGINLWEDTIRMKKEIMDMESHKVIKRRLHHAYALFGERIRAVGPDCGLGSWPSQSMATMLLSNCAKALKSFRTESVSID
ncbi:MAG: methionine synthase [Methanotrichaceae archaeon]|nr:methionine synthase [Methanotrichaceae archaeon]